MSYAYWRKCDFQVHSPRDPNWSGQRPIGEGEQMQGTGAKAQKADVVQARIAWAKDFVNVCLKKGLETVALTDHHEMIMVRYVENELNERRQADPNFDFWLFPGMELTAKGGVQCLIIFDCDLSEDWRQQALGRLGIEYAKLNEYAAQQPAVTQLTCDYPDIGTLLDELEGLRGRYIILPNVSQGNNHTVLREGAHSDFRRMTYVGGYLDRGQTIATLRPKNKTRISGYDNTWSTREIYPLPTSDSRSADYKHLGENNTWIKLAAPTAEAIRQAFLGHRSRIRIETPVIPSLAVAFAKVEGSTILESTELPMSAELNSVIGGRGSGKSSFLEYLAFGLGRSCYDVNRAQYSGSERLSDLIKDTLVANGGNVLLQLVQDGAVFGVTRTQNNAYQPEVTYPNGEKQIVPEKELRSMFPAVVYGQGELAELGKQTGNKTKLSDLLQFVDQEYKREDDGLMRAIEDAKTEVRIAVQKLTSHWTLQADLRKLKTKRASLVQRVAALEKTLPELPQDRQAKVDLYDRANVFESKRVQASKHADQMLTELESVSSELLNERDLDSDLKGYPDTIKTQYHDLYHELTVSIKGLYDRLKAKRKALSDSEAAWSAEFKEMRKKRDIVLEELSAHKAATAQIMKLQEQITEITDQIGDVEAKSNAAGNPSENLQASIKALRQVSERRAERTRQWAAEIEKLSNNKIRASVDVDGDKSEIADAVDTIASKTGSQEGTRMRALKEAFADVSSWGLLDRLRSDCLSLLHWRQMGAATGEEAPKCADLLKVLGDTDKIRTAVTEKMESVRVEAIASAVTKPEIVLTYCDGTKEISFEKASEGQRAAALLFMLLEQTGGPLIIDQPEGDLDNKIITELTDNLHFAKQNRQLIFASHNANIVVNGASELVGYVDISTNGERQFEHMGAIDNPPICQVITSTMEGGEKAFKDRQEKYGY